MHNYTLKIELILVVNTPISC